MKTKKIINKFGIKQTLINMSIDEMKSNFVDKTNFHDCTVANFIEKKVDFIADYKSDSGSEYMFTDEGIYRKSDHWSMNINTCVWLLNGKEEMRDTVGFCSYSNFKKYFSKRIKGVLSNECYQLKDNINSMLNGNFVLKHRIGNII